MRNFWDNISELAVVVICLAIVAAVFAGVVMGVGWLLDPPTTHSVSGRVVKAYMLSCQRCENGYITVQQSNGDLASVEIAAINYGRVNLDDYCKFDVNDRNYVHDLACSPSKSR